MNAAKHVRAQILPEPWGLTSEWFDRLGIRERDRRHYLNLSEIERRKIETDRLLSEYYRRKGLLAEGWTTGRLMKRVREDVDATWLRPGKGRAVDFKHTLGVLETYAQYRVWAERYAETNRTALDVVIPYFIKEGGARYTNYGPGFIHVKVMLYRPWIAGMNQVYWENGTLEIAEIEHTFTGVPNAFMTSPFRPFTHLHERSAIRRFFVGTQNRGLVDYMRLTFSAVVTGKPQMSEQTESLMKGKIEGSYFGDSNIEVRFHRPVIEDLQLLLDLLARWHFDSRVPKSDWQLRFDVGEGWDINVMSLGLEGNRFGSFFVEREHLPTPTGTSKFGGEG